VSILDAIALAGDLAITGRRDNVLLVRVNSDGTKSIARINLNDKNLISSPYFYLQQMMYVCSTKQIQSQFCCCRTSHDFIDF